MSRNKAKNQRPAKGVSGTGVLLLNAQLHPVHYNTEATNILGYPEKSRAVPSLEAVFPAGGSRAESLTGSGAPATFEFTSGRRRYRCRAFLLDSNGNDEDRKEFGRSSPRRLCHPVVSQTTPT